ncbi:intraflagellar transport protein 140 homolog isoform X2 [Contarinia nasturtii]|uniref:intraflagellar transport protein 140 homolog isoform X2 n=1 Tax=Contarinia nasturtii TaxID=265458 RepID=UPI0012D3C81C|nr:intraflagellar transport protein 140 homolog isoform X2 [Contarinia nasturtii]
MTLYFDTKAQFLDGDAVSTVCCWHFTQPLFAVASYNQDRGACVTIFDDSGEPLRDVTYPVHSVSQATALCWHPERRQLVAGWENGELNTWCAGQRTFSTMNCTHKSPIVYIGFSEQGGRMVTADSMGVLIGWRCDSHNGQFTLMFTHDLRDSIVHVTFRKTVKSLVTSELNSLAKAAVAGDEIALDTLANWRPRTAARSLTHTGVKDNQCFYVGCQSGTVFYVNQSGSCNDVLHCDISPIIQMLWHPKREVVVTLMEDMMVGHYMVESTGTFTELERVKLSGKVPGKNGFLSWAGSSLAVITGDFTVRIFDLDTSDSFLLPMSQAKKDTEKSEPVKSIEKIGSPIHMRATRSIMDRDYESDEEIAVTVDETESTKVTTIASKTMEVFTSLAYCNENQTLCAGTNQGNLYIWKRNTSLVMQMVSVSENGYESMENCWHLVNIANVRGAIKFCSWGVCDVSTPCVLVNCISNVYILKEQPLLTAYSPNIWIRQKSSTQLYVEHASNFSTILRCDISAITGLCLNERNLAITNQKNIAIYKIPRADDFKDAKNNKNVSIKQVHTFNVLDCMKIFIYDEMLIVIGYQNVRVYSFGGIVLKEINFNDNEGSPIGASLTHHFMTIFTMNGYLKVFDVSRHEPKLIVPPKSGYDLFGNFGEIIMAKSNMTGSHLAITIANELLVPDGKLYIWDMEKDRLTSYDFLNKNQQINAENEKKSPNEAPTELNSFVRRVPVSFCWDNEDTRIVACETRRLIQPNEKRPPTSMGTMRAPSKLSPINAKLNNENVPDSQVYIMFATNDSRNQIKSIEILDLKFGEQLIDMYTPYVITLKVNQIKRNVLTNFKGIETTSETNRKLILDFSIFIADGKMDEAFRCIRSIQSETVWENLARKCVQTGRLDVAKVCLGNLKKALSVRALRLAMEDDTLEPEAKIAVLAIELQMIPEAESLYKKCGRYDLLNQLLQACGRFQEALQIAERLDRVHLKNTYFDKANNTAHNVTQMLIGEPSLLKQYMSDSTDANMLKWWAQYTESTGDMNGALKIYQKAEDCFSQVRILCFLGDISRADTIARESNDKSACYHLARHYENTGKIQDAIQFYVRAQTYGNAVRICKENNLPNELWTVANLARPRDKAVAAAFFEEIEDYKRAVELYHRSGMLHKAVEMAFASKQVETLQVIAAELDVKSDPELVQRCAEFFITSQQPQKAANLLANAKQYVKSLEVCREYKIPITDNLADLLTPNKDEIEESTRIHILVELGDVLQEQGDYHTATKKFTQAGDKGRAMKSLLKSGDTDKIVFFAGMSRQKEVFIMAANYLQSLNWQSDGRILKNIIQFYSKAHAFDLLANFYANCAQVEIDEFHDYEKAIKALTEASRCVAKMTNDTNTIQHKRVTDNLQNACVEVRKVLEIQDALERGEHNNVVAVCKSMLSIPERPPVRAIHVQAILIEALIRNRRYPEAMEALEDLSSKSTDWSYKGLLEKPLIEKLAHEMNVEFSTIWNMGRQDIANGDETSENDDEIQEEIE